MPVLSDRVGTFTDSVIRRMTRINNQYDSINLSQGFPDFDPPKELLDALAQTAYKGPHQYAVTFGAQNFREALAKKTSPALHHEVDPNTEVCVTCGGTEAMMAAMMTICNPGDKVMIFSPFTKTTAQMPSSLGPNPSISRWSRRLMSLTSASLKRALQRGPRR